MSSFWAGFTPSKLSKRFPGCRDGPKMDCTPKCRFVKHAELILSAITKEDASTAFALLPRVCKNFARVGDQFGRNALHLAASCGKVDLLEWLVKEHSVDLEWKDEESGWTSLHRSLFYGHLNCAVKLLQVCVIIFIKKNYQSTCYP